VTLIKRGGDIHHLSKTFGALGAMMINHCGYPFEIDWTRQVVTFHDEVQKWRVGYTFAQLRVSAVTGTPGQLKETIARDIKATQTMTRG